MRLQRACLSAALSCLHRHRAGSLLVQDLFRHPHARSMHRRPRAALLHQRAGSPRGRVVCHRAARSGDDRGRHLQPAGQRGGPGAAAPAGVPPQPAHPRPAGVRWPLRHRPAARRALLQERARARAVALRLRQAPRARAVHCRGSQRLGHASQGRGDSPARRQLHQAHDRIRHRPGLLQLTAHCDRATAEPVRVRLHSRWRLWRRRDRRWSGRSCDRRPSDGQDARLPSHSQGWHRTGGRRIRVHAGIAAPRQRGHGGGLVRCHGAGHAAHAAHLAAERGGVHVPHPGGEQRRHAAADRTVHGHRVHPRAHPHAQARDVPHRVHAHCRLHRRCHCRRRCADRALQRPIQTAGSG
mmetsp:Transcript_15688/g.49989  ORF Transcript_15688/g.49989 Transcript_15688/m.49989 type:complete len:354 (+) Transcript_15688:302-1363(+)